jgi:hypothetical protein
MLQPVRLPTIRIRAWTNAGQLGGIHPRDGVGLIARNWRTLLWAAPALGALIYGVVVLAEFRSIIEQIYLNSDAAAAPVLGHLAGQVPSGARIVLGNHPWYEEFLFLRLTDALPDYRQLWDVAPMLWSLFGLAALGWSAWRTFGRFAAMIVVCALVCAGAFGRFAFFTFDWHGLSAVHTVLIGVALVWLAPRAAALSWWRIVGLAIGLGLIGVLPAASDRLFLYWALIPTVVTVLAIAWRGAGPMRARMAAFGIVSVGVSLAGGALVAHLLRSADVTSFPFAFTLVPATGVVNNILLTFESYMYLAGGYFFGASTGLSGLALLASGTLEVAALVFVLAEVRRRVARAAPRPVGGDPALGARFTYVVFWTACLVTTTAVYLLTSAPQDVNGARYILAGYVAIGALLALLATRGFRWRLVVTAAVSLFAISGVYQTLQLSFAVTPPTPGAAEAGRLLRYAREEHVSYGYGGYWDAMALTWETKFALQVYPVYECAPATNGLCPFPDIEISSWYTAHPHARSLLIVDPSQQSPSVVGPDAAFGTPVASTTIGDLTVYVFAYNLNTALGA